MSQLPTSKSTTKWSEICWSLPQDISSSEMILKKALLWLELRNLELNQPNKSWIIFSLEIGEGPLKLPMPILPLPEAMLSFKSVYLKVQKPRTSKLKIFLENYLSLTWQDQREELSLKIEGWDLWKELKSTDLFLPWLIASMLWAIKIRKASLSPIE